MALENLFFPLSYTETQLSFRFPRLEFSSFFVVGIVSIEIASYSLLWLKVDGKWVRNILPAFLSTVILYLLVKDLESIEGDFFHSNFTGGPVMYAPWGSILTRKRSLCRWIFCGCLPEKNFFFVQRFAFFFFFSEMAFNENRGKLCESVSQILHLFFHIPTWIVNKYKYYKYSF